MANLVLPDNTVLVNFALIQRTDLLGELANGRGSWCLTVARECSRSAKQDAKLAEMSHAATIFGAPLIPDSGERITTQILRNSIAAPGDLATKSLGEAETVAIMSNRNIDGIFLTDDGDARTLATRHKIATASTWDLLRLAYRTDKIRKSVLAGYLESLKREGRGSPAGMTNPATFEAWLDS